MVPPIIESTMMEMRAVKTSSDFLSPPTLSVNDFPYPGLNPIPSSVRMQQWVAQISYSILRVNTMSSYRKTKYSPENSKTLKLIFLVKLTI